MPVPVPLPAPAPVSLLRLFLSLSNEEIYWKGTWLLRLCIWAITSFVVLAIGLRYMHAVASRSAYRKYSVSIVSVVSIV